MNRVPFEGTEARPAVPNFTIRYIKKCLFQKTAVILEKQGQRKREHQIEKTEKMLLAQVHQKESKNHHFLSPKWVNQYNFSPQRVRESFVCRKIQRHKTHYTFPNTLYFPPIRTSRQMSTYRTSWQKIVRFPAAKQLALREPKTMERRQTATTASSFHEAKDGWLLGRDREKLPAEVWGWQDPNTLPKRIILYGLSSNTHTVASAEMCAKLTVGSSNSSGLEESYLCMIVYNCLPT